MRALFDTYGAMLGYAILVHTGYVLICVTVGFFLGLLLGVALSRMPRISGIVLPVISVFQTIPGLVFIGLLFLWLGMVPMTVIIALSIYAMFPVLKTPIPVFWVWSKNIWRPPKAAACLNFSPCCELSFLWQCQALSQGFVCLLSTRYPGRYLRQ